MKKERYSIYDLGYNKHLIKDDSFYDEIARMANAVENEVNPSIIGSGGMTGNYDLVDGHFRSSNFVSGSAGWEITADGDAEFNSVTVRGTIYATLGEIGGFTIGATTLYSDGDEIVLDSANKRIEVGADDAIVLDGANKKITVGASNEIIIDGANKKIESGNYVSGYAGSGFHIDENLGEFGNIACRGLIRTACFQKSVISVMGGSFAVLDGDVLDADMTALDNSTLETKATTTFSTGDILRIKDGTDDEWLEVTAVNGAVYTVNRDKKGDYGADANPAWKKGATIVNYRQSGDGGVYTTASEANAPYLSIFTHAGSPWTDLTTRLRIGNLNGYLGYTTDKYGIGIGDTDNYLKYDPTNHLRISGKIVSSSFQTATTLERMEMGISEGGSVHNITKRNAAGNIEVGLGGHGVSGMGYFANYSATGIVLNIQQEVGSGYGIFVDMETGVTGVGIKITNLGSGDDIQGHNDNWSITKAGVGAFDGVVSVATPTANGHATTKLYVDNKGSGDSVFGDGSDGDITISSSTTISRDMFYNNLTLNGDLNTNGWRVFVKGTLTINSGHKIHRNGNDGGSGGTGGNGAGGSGGSGGAAGGGGGALPTNSIQGAMAGVTGGVGSGGSGGSFVPDAGSAGNNGTNVAKCITSQAGVIGVAGGKGGDACGGVRPTGANGGSGGAAGNNTGTVYNMPKSVEGAYNLIDWDGLTLAYLNTSAISGAGGGGGAGAGHSGASCGGYSGSGGGGGGSGSAGGIVFLAAKTVVNNGGISANGGNGGNGGAGGNAYSNGSGAGGGAGGGGAGGGSGGVVILIYGSKTGNAPTANGGNGGNGGAGGSGNTEVGSCGCLGDNGNAGSNAISGLIGKVITIKN